jgi:hypothetical protein
MEKINSMRTEMDMVNSSYEPLWGDDINTAINEAIEVAKKKGKTIRFYFNDVTISVNSDSDPSLIHRDWHRATNSYTNKEVGPKPNLVLTKKEIENDARIDALNEELYKLYQENNEMKNQGN